MALMIFPDFPTESWLNHVQCWKSVNIFFCTYHLSVEIFHKTFFKITNRLNMRKTFTGSDNSDHCSILSRKLLASQNWVTHWSGFEPVGGNS